jgi:hypothetical protein
MHRFAIAVAGATYLWAFGDGTSSPLQSNVITHTFTIAGPGNVLLEVGPPSSTPSFDAQSVTCH